MKICLGVYMDSEVPEWYVHLGSLIRAFTFPYEFMTYAPITDSDQPVQPGSHIVH